MHTLRINERPRNETDTTRTRQSPHARENQRLAAVIFLHELNRILAHTYTRLHQSMSRLCPSIVTLEPSERELVIPYIPWGVKRERELLFQGLEMMAGREIERAEHHSASFRYNEPSSLLPSSLRKSLFNSKQHFVKASDFSQKHPAGTSCLE